MKKLRSLDDLKEWDKNPREIDTRQFNGLKNSLAEFGDLSGITFNRKLNALVCGHQRLKAIREQWGEEAKFDPQAGVIVLPNGNTFPVRMVEWDELKHAAANIAANNQHLAGTYTSDMAVLMDDIEKNAPELMAGLNFDSLKIELEAFWKSQELKEDIAPPLPKVAKTKPGDLYEIGQHRLLCGDCTKEDDFKRLMGPDKARLIFTDPPYNVDYESASGRSYDSTHYGGKGSKIFNDNKKEDDCIAFYTKALQNLYAFTSDDATVYWWFAIKNQHMNRQAFVDAGWTFNQIIIWLKNGFVFAPGQEYHRCYEPCMLGWKKGKKHFATKMFNSLTDLFSLEFQEFQEQLLVWFERRDVTNTYVHPTQKPVRLAERALKKNSRVGDIVLDVFGGSGSTLIGCEQLGRKCYSIELDPKFCDVIITRFCNFTQQNKVVLNGKTITWKVK